MPYWRMVVYPTDAGVFLLNLLMSIGTWNILVAKCSNSVAALLLARKHADSLMGKDSPWPLHLASLILQAAHLFFLFLTLLVSCSFSGASLQTAHFHLHSPCSSLRPGPNLPPQARSSRAASRGPSLCSSSPARSPLPTLTREFFPWPGRSSSFPFLLCPGKTEVLLCPLQLPPGTRAGRVRFPDN